MKDYLQSLVALLVLNGGYFLCDEDSSMAPKSDLVTHAKKESLRSERLFSNVLITGCFLRCKPCLGRRRCTVLPNRILPSFL